MTSREFVRWAAFYRLEWENADRTIYQMALLSYQLYLIMHMFGGTPTKGIDSFVLDFTTPEKDAKDKGEAMKSESDEIRNRFGPMLAGLEQLKNQTNEIRALREKARQIGKRYDDKQKAAAKSKTKPRNRKKN